MVLKLKQTKNNLKINLAAPLQIDSILDGEGIRTVIWTQGCKHNCPFCHNPQTHSFEEALLLDVETVKEEIKNLKGQNGITFSGGDPIYQIESVLDIAKYASSLDLDIWLYSGFTYEEIIKMPLGEELLKTIDVLVDGLFINKLKSLDLPFRGSENQRIIDMKETRKTGEVILHELNKFTPMKRSKDNE